MSNVQTYWTIRAKAINWTRSKAIAEDCDQATPSLTLAGD